jgi:hypothetical protein
MQIEFYENELNELQLKNKSKLILCRIKIRI